MVDAEQLYLIYFITFCEDYSHILPCVFGFAAHRRSTSVFPVWSGRGQSTVDLNQRTVHEPLSTTDNMCVWVRVRVSPNPIPNPIVLKG